MTRCDEIVCLVRSDAKYEQNVEIEHKDFTYQRTYGNKEENQDIVPCVIFSDVHEKLDNIYVPYNDFESPNITNKKGFIITNINDVKCTSH